MNSDLNFEYQEESDERESARVVAEVKSDDHKDKRDPTSLPPGDTSTLESS
jgi:hypothetical protein